MSPIILTLRNTLDTFTSLLHAACYFQHLWIIGSFSHWQTATAYFVIAQASAPYPQMTVPQKCTQNKNKLKKTDWLYMYIPSRQHNLLLPETLRFNQSCKSILHIPITHHNISFFTVHLFVGDIIEISNC